MKLDKLAAILSLAILLAAATTAVAQEPAKPAEPQVKQEQSKDVEIGRITVEELKSKIEKKEPVTIIDARSKSSYDSSDKKIKGAVRMTSEDVNQQSKALPRDTEVVVYCA